MNLADDAILIVVDALEQVGEPDQEAFVLLKLEVQDDFSEVRVLQLGALA